MDIKQINEMLASGKSMAQIERELGYGKDTLRKKLNRHGYKLNRQCRQYELLAIDTQSNCNSEIVPKSNITSKVTSGYIDSRFDESDMTILYKIIEEYKLKESIRVVESNIDDKLDNRNIRVYVNHYKQFANWCKENNITQADALRKAIDLLMGTTR